MARRPQYPEFPAMTLKAQKRGPYAGNSPTPTPTPTPTPNVIFSAQSPWNSYPQNPQFGANTVPADQNNPWVEQGAYASKAFYAASTDGPMTIYGSDGGASIDIANQLNPGTVVIPRFPTATSPAVGTDGHAEIVDLVDGTVHSFYQLVFSGGKWKTSKYAKTSLTGRGFGTVSRPDNVRAAGCSTLGGLLTKAELGLNIVPHALAMSMDRNAFKSGYVYPATLEDYTGWQDYGNIAGHNFPMGGLMMLPANFNAEALALPTSRAIARTLKKYGAYIVDATEDSMNFYAEIDSGWNAAYASGSYDSNFGYDMEAIKAALRQVTGYTAMLDRDGVAYTPPLLKNMNLLSMRGPWEAAYARLDGAYDAVSDLYQTPATSDALNMRQVLFVHVEGGEHFFDWKGKQAWNLNPELNTAYKVSVFGNGPISATMNVRHLNSDGTYGAQLVTTNKLSPGQTFNFTWPNDASTITEIYIDKDIGAAAGVRMEMTKVV